ncbi:hypothetical protein GOBAR_DD30629 [Gossypium barbadense]|nr:hypothetical protein GOBAR_DD30629 [Gossypium barbadense]
MLMPSALYASVDKYLHGLFGLANEPPAEVRKLVCAAFVQLIEVRPSVLEPHMKNVIEYMLQVNKDTDDEVALEACEFWTWSLASLLAFLVLTISVVAATIMNSSCDTWIGCERVQGIVLEQDNIDPMFMKVSGGLDGGSDPAAFQRAEKERLEKLSIQENAKVCSVIILSKGLRTVKG